MHIKSRRTYFTVLIICLLLLSTSVSGADSLAPNISQPSPEYSSLIEKCTSSEVAEISVEYQQILKNQAERLQSLATGESISVSATLDFYESEPNNTRSQADYITSNLNGANSYLVYGTITDYYNDLDFYRVDVTQTGTLVIMGKWLGTYYDYDWEEDLGIGLLNAGETILGWTAPYMIDGTEWAVLVYENLAPGTYYLVALQALEGNMYVGEVYGFGLDLIPNSCSVSIPSTPSGNSSGITGNTYTFSTGGASCSAGHGVQYRFDWGDGTYSNWSNSTSATKTWISPGNYSVRAQARCATYNSAISDWSNSKTVSIALSCQLTAPIITQSHGTGEILTSYQYIIEPVSCNQGHDTQYRFDWGDGSFSAWSTANFASKTWSTVGTYNVKAQTRCAVNPSVLSPWSAAAPIEITAPPVDLTITANILEGGSFSGDGTYPMTSTVRVQAYANPGYIFHNWVENGSNVTRSNPYSFTLMDHRSLLLQFRIRMQPQRIFGDNRFSTSIEVSKTGWEADSTDYVVLARSHDFADALAGVPLAYALNAPILLTTTQTVYSSTLAEIDRLGANNVILLGGTGAISAEVETILTGHGLNVERVYGSSRYATAAAIARRLAQEIGPISDAVIAVGTNFPDALSAASYAAIRGQPILLVHNTFLPESTSEVITELSINNVVIAGGKVAVSDSVMDELPVAGSKTRVADVDRYGTAVAMANHFNLDTTHYCLATGYNFPDAITGAVLAAKMNSGVLLVYGASSEPPTLVQNFLVDRTFSAITLFGGTSVISTEMESWF